MSALVDVSLCTPIGDLTSGGGLAAAVTYGDSGTTGYATTTDGYAGWSLNTPQVILSCDVISASNGFDASGLTSSITLTLYGKQGSAPSSRTNGTVLGTTTFTDINAVTTKNISSSDTTTLWDHVWVTGHTGVWVVFESVRPYTDVVYTPTQPSDATDKYVATRVNLTGNLFNYSHTEIPDFRLNFSTTLTTGVIKIWFRVACTHRGEFTGYNDVIGVGCKLGYRYSSNFATLQSQSITWLKTGGDNICERNPDHYTNIELHDAFPITQAGHYQFVISMNAATSATGWTTTNGLGAVFALSGENLNCFMIDYDPDATLVQT